MKFIFVIFTFWDVDNEERPKRPGPADALYPSLSQAGVDADVEDGEGEDGDGAPGAVPGAFLAVEHRLPPPNV